MDIKKALETRHPIHAAHAALWQFYSDCYEGGLLWPQKENPIGLGLAGGVFAVTASAIKNAGRRTSEATYYLWRYPLEKQEKFLHRLQRAAYINILAPVVDYYAAAVGKAENVLQTPDENFADFEDDADLQGQSLIQFMAGPRRTAAVCGHTFLFVDSTAQTGELRSERDAREMGIRPYIYEIEPAAMLNWRLDKDGRAIEVLFEDHGEVDGPIMDGADRGMTRRFRHWTREKWTVYREDDNHAVIEESSGSNPIGVVPVVPLYHRRRRAWLGDSLLRDSAKLAQIASNWVSALDESFEAQMFALPWIKSTKTPEEVGVGVSTVLHLNPEEGEEFGFAAPDVGPFDSAWSAWARIVGMANRAMGMPDKPITAEGANTPDPQSGVSKEWDFQETEKILSAMALHEQEAVLMIMELASKWAGKEWKGSLQYAMRYDLSTATEDISDLLSLQAAGLPVTARKELMRRIISKKMPSLSEETAAAIEKEIETLEEIPDLATQMESRTEKSGDG